MRLRVADSHLRGRLARRLLMVFVLASVIPVLVTSLLCYAQLVSGADAARARALHDEAKESALTFLSQLQTASAELPLLEHAARGSSGPRAQWPFPFSAVSFTPVGTTAQWRGALASIPQPMRAALIAGKPILVWSRRAGGHSQLSLVQRLSARAQLAWGTLDSRRMLDEARPVEPGAGIALAENPGARRLILSDAEPVPRQAFEGMAGSSARGGAATLWRSGGGRWRGTGWNLFLQGGFAAPPIRILICESAHDSIAGLAGLRLTIPMMLLGTLAFAAWLAIALLRRYLGPLGTLTAATRELGASNFDVELRLSTHDELSELGEDFNRMARSLRDQHRELERRAQVDGLTGLSNRDFFRQRLGDTLACGQRAALLYIDLDDFKKVNDSAGHEAGDTLLKEMAARLRACAAPAETVARLGGDEFALLLAGGAGTGEAIAAAARVLAAVQAPMLVGGAERRMSASIGVALIPDHGDTVDLLLRNSDIAMYQAKERGRNGVAFFSPEMHQHMQERISLETALQNAVARNELRLHYQPISSAGRLSGVEALVRWARPSGGELGPAQFIPIAEQSGLIVTVGEWVMKQACADFARWRAAGIAPGYVSVNVAPRQLESRDFLPRLQAIMAERHMSPAEIQLEVTESAIADGPQVAATLERLHELGLRLALDDFGTGYSSLSQLQRLPFDVVKIDRSFIIGLPDSQVGLQLVRTILRMTESLDKRAVAEGVETEAQRDLLHALGCREMQGYLFGKPVPERQLRGLLQAAADEPRPAEPAAGMNA